MSESLHLGPESDRSSEAALVLERVSVCYKVSGDRRKVTAGKLLSNLMLGRSSRRDVWALQDVSLVLRRRETRGLVGPNGAGKSTLLKVVARVIRPKRGRVLVGGLVAPLIELGAGFNGELTGRENLYLKAAMHGLTCRHIRKRVDSIIDFSGLDDFIDVPLRTYSTGMIARLAFSVAVDARPDVLLVDEVMGIGDTDFQHRCQARVEELRRSGTAVLLVSHGLQLVRTWCDLAAWLSYGRVQMSGPAAEVVDAYEGVAGAVAGPADRKHRPRSVRVLMDGVIDGSGWYSKELHPRLGPYRWTGPQSRSTLRLPPPGDLAHGDALVRFRIIVLVSPSVLQRLRVSLNGRAVPLMEFRLEDGSRIMEGLVPHGTVDASCPIEVTFDVGATESPDCSSFGYVDSRMLGIAVGWVEFAALGTEQQAHESDGVDSMVRSRGWL